MASVIDFLEFKGHSAAPTLVLVGLHRHPDGDDGAFGADAVLAKCRTALKRARAAGIPVAHARSLGPGGGGGVLRYPPWIAGFEPVRSDMVFDLLRPSCYSNMEFSRAMDHSGGNFAIAGMFGETACLATAIDAHHRRHGFTYLADATAYRGAGSMPAHAFHDAVTQLMSCYGAVMEVAGWGRHLGLRRVVS